MTVLGGLQFGKEVIRGAFQSSFNTDDGIRRATIDIPFLNTIRRNDSFNTDDGIRRATIEKNHPTEKAGMTFQYR